MIEGLRRVDGGWRILPNIATPTFVLRGAESIVTSAEGTADLSNGLPNREVQEIKGGSHMLPLEHPKEVAAAVRDWIFPRFCRHAIFSRRSRFIVNG